MSAAPIPHSRTKPVLRASNVSLSFGEKVILRDVNVEIDILHRDSGETTGQVVAFLGPSGIGKSQLLRILAGLQAPTSGSVLVGEEQVPTHAGLVGMVSQRYYLYRNRTVMGNLMVSAMQRFNVTQWLPRLRIFPPSVKFPCLEVSRARCLEMLERFDLVELRDRYPAELSGGQQQRVAILQQMLCSEHFLLLDEPTSGLDPLSKRRVCQFLSEVANQDDLNTIVMVTHDIPAAIAVADTIWLMGRERDGDGRVIPGARIVEEYDLIERGLCWDPDVRRHPSFAPLVEEIQERFRDL